MEEFKIMSAVAEERTGIGPQRADLDKCVHCGLCLNACPTYRELGVEMDSPRGRIYQMNQVAQGAPISKAYIHHLDLCLGCRACETACPSGVPYGRLIEAAREEILPKRKLSKSAARYQRWFFEKLLPSRPALQMVGGLLYLYQMSGVQKLVRLTGALKLLGHNLVNLEVLAPNAEIPFFYSKIGKTFPALGEKRFRVAFVAGCIANVTFARLNEATVRVLQRNGCDVVIPPAQGCCGALHLHAGMADDAKALARNNVDAFIPEEYDAILTNAAGCGSTLKEYGHLLDADYDYSEPARRFAEKVQDVTEFLASVELNDQMGSLEGIVTYQDSCHLAHGQRVKDAPRKLLQSIPGLEYRELPQADICCGSAGIYNVVENEMSMQILRHKMELVKSTEADIIATANPGCMLQLQAGVKLYAKKQRVLHVVQVLDEAYQNYMMALVKKKKSAKSAARRRSS
jgi:glycolate oxidase iron-sulfur subunit